MPLDIEQPEALLNYLRTNGRIGPNEQASIHTLGGGVSNRTVLVERANGEAWVIKQALRRLRVPVEWYSPPERIPMPRISHHLQLLQTFNVAERRP